MNLDSIRHAASISGGQIGEALTTFCQSTSEEEKQGLVSWLVAKVFPDSQNLHPDGRDAADFMKTLLESLRTGGLIRDGVFYQDLDVASHCSSCGGERISRRSTLPRDGLNLRKSLLTTVVLILIKFLLFAQRPVFDTFQIFIVYLIVVLFCYGNLLTLVTSKRPMCFCLHALMH